MERRRLSALEVVGMLIVIVIVGAVLWSQQSMFNARDRDTARKTAVNHIYYYLETMYYPLHHFYPASLQADQLSGLNRSYLSDPKGRTVGTSASDFHYDPYQCNQGQCAGYSLRSSLELEADFVQSSNR